MAAADPLGSRAGGVRLPQEYGAKTKGRHKPAILLLSFIAALRGACFVHLSFRVKSAFANVV
jgi:hypothetical protein